MLKLKKLLNEDEWRGKVSYQDFEMEISDPSEVEVEINKGECPMFVRHHLLGRLVTRVKWEGSVCHCFSPSLAGPMLLPWEPSLPSLHQAPAPLSLLFFDPR